MPPATAETAPVDAAAGLFRALADELLREDQQLLFPLMTRMNEIAELLGQGEAVDPAYIDGGVRLWSRYVNEVHQQRIERLYGVFRDIIQLPGPARKLERRRGVHVRAEKAEAAQEETGLDKYNEIRGTQTRMAERIGVLKGLVDAYRRGEYYSPQMLASLLRSGAFSDRAWAKYEEEFVLKYLNEHVAPEEDLRLRKEIAASDELRRQVESEVAQFLAHPVPKKGPPT